MIERRPILTVTRHALLLAGVAVVAFPIWVTFVASSLTLDQVLALKREEAQALVANTTGP